jgi:NAD(P)-dependent dehydrogenase (short-subunit alcohol dehydrogenase family)
MRGKICLITGASSGIGQAAAAGLARLGATVVLVCRDRERGETARSEIMRLTGNESVELLVADLASQAEIHRLAREFDESHDRLHLLVNNAGVELWERAVTEDGIEATLAINHLAPFLLTHLLGDTLKVSAPSRIVNVSSMVHRWARIDLDDLHGDHDYNPNRAYYQSKLAILLFTYELSRILEGTGVTANAMEPGMVRTNFTRDFRGFYRLMAFLWRPFMRTPAEGADTIIYLASSPEMDGVTGGYFKDRRRIKSSDTSYDSHVARRLWNLSVMLTGIDGATGPAGEATPPTAQSAD